MQDFLSDASAPDLRNIIDIKCEHYYEIGSEKGRLHAHAILWVDHTGKFTLNNSRIKEYAQAASELGFALK